VEYHDHVIGGRSKEPNHAQPELVFGRERVDRDIGVSDAF
jgi:hypothetical protein